MPTPFDKLLAGLLGLLAILPAPSVQGAEKETKLPVSIFCTTYADGLKSVFVKTPDDGYRAIGLSTANVIDGGEVTAQDGKIPIHGPMDADGAYPVVATAGVAGIRSPLLLLAPGGKDGPLYQATVVESAPDGFPAGSFKFVNLSPHPVRVTLGEDVIEVLSGGEALLKPNVKPGEVVPVTIDHKSGDTWQLMSSARWASRQDRRTLVCFQLDPSSKRMVVKSVPLR